MIMVKKILLSILNFVIRSSLLVLIVLGVYRLAMYSYHFGYMVFADAAMEPAPGRDIVLTIDSTEDTLDVGRLLKARGLVSDEKIFYLQERLSDYHGKMMPGTYTLNTSMKTEEMLETLSSSYQEEGEDGEERPENEDGDVEQSTEEPDFADPAVMEPADADQAETDADSYDGGLDEPADDVQEDETQADNPYGAGAGL